MRTVNEGSAYDTIVYFETNDVAVTPGTVYYSARCETTRTELVPITALVTGESVAITIPAALNNIIQSIHPYESKVITVYTDYGTDAQQTAEERYRVKNLGGVGDPVDGTSDYGE